MSFLQNFNIIDLSHRLHSSIPSWEGGCGFKHKTLSPLSDKKETDFHVQSLHMLAGIGTHIDAPAHCIPNSPSVEELPLDRLITDCVLIDLSPLSETSTVGIESLHAFEKKHGEIPKKSFVIFYTGWERHWQTANKYINGHLFPCLSAELAELLIERHIAGIGIDTLSPDRPGNDFPVHRLLLQKGIYIVENVANAHKVSPTGSYSFALPLPISGGTESPLRLIALVPKQR